MFQLTAILLFFLSLGLSACSEAPLITKDVTAGLNNPISMALVPGTNLAVVANANVNLSEKDGSLIAVNLDTKAIATDSLISIPSFAGRIAVDTGRNRVYVPSKSDLALLIYSYVVPGPGGESISFSPVPVSSPADKAANGVQTDKDPYDVYIAPATSSGDVAYVSNITDGSISVIPLDTLTPLKLNSYDSSKFGFPLISAANFWNESSLPGKGANRLVPTPDGKLLYVGSTFTTDVYVLNVAKHSVRGMLDLSTLTALPGVRGIAFDSTGHYAYMAIRGLGGVAVLDVSQVNDGGPDYEVLDARVLKIIPTGRGPESLWLTPDDQHLFVTNELDNTVVKVKLSDSSIEARTVVGNVPSELIPDSTRGVLYVLNFLSNSISILDQASGALTGTIQ